MKSAASLLLLLLALCGCKNENAKPPFSLQAPASAVTDGDLEELLANAPFENPFHEDEDRGAITNVLQVFPFAGKYYGTYGKLRDYGSEAEVYERHIRAFEDPRFGNAFIQAALLYGDDPVAIPKTTSEGANVLIEGLDRINARYSATAYATGLRDSAADYRADVFWLEGDRERFLGGLYQRGQLLVDFGFPCRDTLACLQQLVDINNSLGLGVAAWDQATAADLRPDPTEDPFWSDPDVSLLRVPGSFFPRLYLPLKALGFTEIRPSAANTKLFREADHVFRAERDGGVYEFAVSARPTEESYESFDASMQEAGFAALQPVLLRPIYETGTTVHGGTTITAWKAYLDEGEMVELSGAYPSGAAAFLEEQRAVLRRGRVVNL